MVWKTNQKILLLLLLNSIQVFPIYGDVLQSESTSIIKTDQFLATYNDISQGWININYESDIQPDVSKVFLQGQDILGNQKGVLVQAANLGNSNFRAQKVIPMKKGHKYDLDLIYGQHYDSQGGGFIDFNGHKITATNDPTEQHYKETVIPSEDMNYVITASFTTVYPGNAYFKVAYDKSTGGITEYEPKNIIVNYIDCQNNVISPSQTLSGGFNETYSTEQKEIEGYTFKEVQGNPKGQFTDKVQTVTYVYTKDKVNPKPGDNKPIHENNTPKPGDNKPIHENNTLKPGDNKPIHENNTLKPGDNKSSHENNVHISEISSSTREALPKTGDNERMTLMSIGTGIIILLGTLVISIFRIKKNI